MWFAIRSIILKMDNVCSISAFVKMVSLGQLRSVLKMELPSVIHASLATISRMTVALKILAAVQTVTLFPVRPA